MFHFFKKKLPVIPPTEKQLSYAKRLGITVTPDMGISELSAAIGEAERKNPTARQKREEIKQRQRVRELGPELVHLEEKWTRFAEEIAYMLAIYQRGKNTIVDVLLVIDAVIDGARTKKIRLTVAAPKLIKERDIGDWLDWETEFALPLEKLLHYEPLHTDFCGDGIPAYQQVVKRGLKIAKKL